MRAGPEDDAMQDIGRDAGGSRDDAAWTGAGGPGPRIMAADTLQGDDVYNAADEKLGEITDIMIDVPSGRVAYAVMSVGGVLGLGDKLFAVPWSALRLDTERKCFRLDASKERVENAPGFDKDHWPSMADPTWASEVHGYYGAEPYWA
jgi:sporulation protein YlmC with PRC-barrel domain